MARTNENKRPVQLQINQAQNGYVVEEGLNNGNTVFDPLVFQTKNELLTYIDDHFDHEQASVKTD